MPGSTAVRRRDQVARSLGSRCRPVGGAARPQSTRLARSRLSTPRRTAPTGRVVRGHHQPSRRRATRYRRDATAGSRPHSTIDPVGAQEPQFERNAGPRHRHDRQLGSSASSDRVLIGPARGRAEPQCGRLPATRRELRDRAQRRCPDALLIGRPRPPPPCSPHRGRQRARARGPFRPSLTRPQRSSRPGRGPRRRTPNHLDNARKDIVEPAIARDRRAGVVELLASPTGRQSTSGSSSGASSPDVASTNVRAASASRAFRPSCTAMRSNSATRAGSAASSSSRTPDPRAQHPSPPPSRRSADRLRMAPPPGAAFGPLSDVGGAILAPTW